MQIIQTASAVYLLIIAAYCATGYLRYVATGKNAEANIKGLPAVLLYLAAIVCAVTTLASIN